MKKLIIGLSVLLALSMLVGCGKKEEETNLEEVSILDNENNSGNNVPEKTSGEEISDEKVQNFSDSRLLKNMSKSNYYLKYEFTDADGTITAEYSKDGNKFASTVTADDTSARTVQEDGVLYTIFDTEKIMAKDTITDTNNLANSDFMGSEDVTFTSGNTTIDGKEYYYEDFQGSKFYFEGNALKYIGTNEENGLINVIVTENVSHPDMFVIPTDYMDFSEYIQQQQ